MKNTKFASNLLILIVVLLTSGRLLASSSGKVSSPDGTLKCLISQNDGKLIWSVDFHGKPIVEKSPLILTLDGVEITSDVKMGAQKSFKVNETYPWYGLHTPAINHCYGSIIEFTHGISKIKYQLEVRVFNDAAAFRLTIPGAENVNRTPDESTVFKIPAGSTVWYHDLYMHYEGVHSRKLLDTIPAGQWAATPVTVKLPGKRGYAAIAEADLKNYAGMALQSDGKLGFTLRLAHNQPVSYPYKLRYSPEDVERLSKIASITGTITTPWCVVMVAKDLNTLVNCDALSNLCAAPDPIERKAFLTRCHDLGITGVKIDFFDHEAKEVIDLYSSLLRETAEQHLLVDFHGANKPSGEARTWPNELTREAVKGMEASKLADRATHEVTLPFTRYLAGHAEYTPVHFGDRRKNTTWVHQLASAAILWAPVQTYAANPDNLLANPAVELIKSLPAVWDETIVLPPSEIGEIAIYAQRKGNIWFLSVMNGLQPRQVRIPLSFLTEKSYKSLEAHDNPSDPASVKMKENKVGPADIVDLQLGEGSGFLVRYVPVR